MFFQLVCDEVVASDVVLVLGTVTYTAILATT
jgi:hypothetical protein